MEKFSGGRGEEITIMYIYRMHPEHLLLRACLRLLIFRLL